MIKTRTYVFGLLVALAMVGGVVAGPADAGNAICPSICLTGGVLAGGRSTATVAGVNEGNGMESRHYSFTWVAADATGKTPVGTYSISITAAGHAGGTSFAGSATISDGSSSETIGVSGSDNGITTSFSGGGFSLTALNLGAGEAHWLRNHDWPGAGDGGDCDGHENNGGLGHIIGNGGGHDCDDG